MKALVAVISGLLLSAPLAAHASDGTSGNQSEAQTSAPASEEARSESAEAETATEDPGERRICRRIPSTGSNRADRVCMTARQWREYGSR